MSSKSPVSAKDDQELMATLWCDDMRHYPERAVLFGFPWGVAGTPLEKKQAPRKWQLEELTKYGAHIRENVRRASQGLPLVTYQFACVSGRGIGKSALMGMVAWFQETCWPGSTTIIAANGEAQLDSKTFPEIKKWFTLAINAHWFDLAARSVRPQQWFREQIETQLKIDCGYYYVQGQLWTEEKPDSFAGAHNPAGLIVMFDEASGIPEAIWTVAKGFFTEDCVTRAHFAFSNGRKNTGPFFECFHKMRAFWNKRMIDSRTVEGVDTADLLQIIVKHGEDSDEARIEVRGMFPHKGSRQLIGRDTIDNAAARVTEPDSMAALTMAVDVARFGENKSVISFKHGRDARSIPWQSYSKIKTTELARHIFEAAEKYNPDAIFIDSNGVGGPVCDMLEDNYKLVVVHVNFGESADDDKKYEGKRTECWCRMADWLEIGAIPDNTDLKDDLASPEFDYVGRESKKFLEPKEKTQANGLASPDYGDSLALHFAKPVARRDMQANSKRRRNGVAKDVDYPVLS